MNAEFHVIKMDNAIIMGKLFNIHVALPSYTSKSKFKHNITDFLFLWVKKEALWQLWHYGNCEPMALMMMLLLSYNHT